jgi:hypothetical protein
LLFSRGSGCARLTAGRHARRCDVDVAAKWLQRAKAELKRPSGRNGTLTVVRARRALPHNLLRFVDLESRLLEMLDHPGG